MAYRPPQGVRPPQLEGKRTGRPKGSKNLAGAWRDAHWAHAHAYDEEAVPPTAGARLWWFFAGRYPEELEEFLEAFGQL